MVKKTRITITVKSVPTEIIVPSIQYNRQQRRHACVVPIIISCLALVGISVGIYWGLIWSRQVRRQSQQFSAINNSSSTNRNSHNYTFLNNESTVAYVDNSNLDNVTNNMLMNDTTSMLTSKNNNSAHRQTNRRRYLKYIPEG